MPESPASLVQLADEIIAEILVLLPVDSLLNVQFVSKRLNRLANDRRVWRHVCTRWKYWNPAHHYKTKLSLPASEPDWKHLGLLRHNIDVMTDADFEAILSGQPDPTSKVERIKSHGYNAKDALLRHFNAPADADDLLARRHCADTQLGSVHRMLAVLEWNKVFRGQQPSIERALAASSMFMLGAGWGDLEEIIEALDTLAEKALVEIPEFRRLPTRQKALAIATFLRAQGFKGVDQDAFLDLENNFLGVALADNRHRSGPLISSVIYCSVATRLGLCATPAWYPLHVYVTVRSYGEISLDGDPLPNNAPPEVMYLDPFRNDREAPLRWLLAALEHVDGGENFVVDGELIMADAPDLLVRSSRNIQISLQKLLELGSTPWWQSDLDRNAAKYAASWVSFLSERDQVTNVERLFNTVRSYFEVDMDLVQWFVLPVLQGLREYRYVQAIVGDMRALDAKPKPVQSRNGENGHVKYYVGQLMRHRRYRYYGVITGWAPKCEAEIRWIERHAVDSLPHGRNQAFYEVS